MGKDNIQTLKKENNELKLFNVTFVLLFTFCTTYIILFGVRILCYIDTAHLDKPLLFVGSEKLKL